MNNEEVYQQLLEARNAEQQIKDEIKRLKNILAEAVALETHGIRINDRVTDSDGNVWVVKNIKLLSWPNKCVIYEGFRINKNGKIGKILNYIREPKIYKEVYHENNDR